MLPNWLYGKSKSKLQEILGGGGGTPADYNQVKAKVNQNTEDIALLNDTLDEKAALTQISNPNLLDNPWFTVNQRNKTSSPTGGYTVDRWTARNTTEISISDSIVTLVNNRSDGSTWFGQLFELDIFTRLIGKTLTYSFMLSNGEVKSWTFTLQSTNSQSSDFVLDNATVYLNVEWGQDKLNVLVWLRNLNDTVSIKAMKLELGSVSTLAMDTEPNYATELLKCQRYFIRYTNNTQYSTHTAIGVAQTATNIFVDLILPSQMRTKPTLVAPSIAIEAPGTATVSGTPSISFGAPLMNNIARLTITGLIDLTVGSPYYFIIPAGSYIDFDAEL